MISPVFKSVLNGIWGNESPAGPCKTLPVAASYFDPWHGQISCPSVSRFIRQPACVHLLEKTFNDATDFITINLSNKKIPVPSLETLNLLITGSSDSCFCLLVSICQSTIKPAVTVNTDNLKNALRLKVLPVSKSLFISRQNYKDFLSIELSFIIREAVRIMLFYDLWQVLIWVVIIYRNMLIFCNIKLAYGIYKDSE